MRDSLLDENPDQKVSIIALNDGGYDYNSEVFLQIADDDLPCYSKSAELINKQGFKVLSVQHEFGIFGGPAGNYLLELLRSVKIPIVTTLHTVLRTYTPEQEAVLRELIQLSTRVVVMSRTAIDLLKQTHDIDVSKVDFIPHGIPWVPVDAGQKLRAQLGITGPLILTFGLLSPDKGIENVIRALPALAKALPSVKYLLVGATHPHVKAFAGETYRNSLIRLSESLGVTQNIAFVNDFVDIDRLIGYLSASDFYITPYLNPMQITSGTLAYSMGAGKIVISTPYEYAKEMLANGRGILVPFSNPEAIAAAILDSWNDKEGYTAMRHRATSYGSQMYWPRIARLYQICFRRGNDDSKVSSVPMSTISKPTPRLSLKHLDLLTDDTGLFQHARFSTPYWDEGYCTDDNARGLILTLFLEQQNPFQQRIKTLQAKYFTFVVNSYSESSGGFRNFLSHERKWLEAKGSDDSQGRAIWALGMVVGRSESCMHVEFAKKLFKKVAPSLQQTTSPRAWAYAILGAVEFLKSQPDDKAVTHILTALSGKLHALFIPNSKVGWTWLEPRLSYANARIPQALMEAGSLLGIREMRERGLAALDWLVDLQMSNRGIFSPVGSLGAGPDDFGRAQYDQQPIEAWSTISACLSAYRITAKERYREIASLCILWFAGRNDKSVPVANDETGACFDGVTQDGVNLNQGAESTLAYLCSVAELRIASKEVAKTTRSGVL